MRSLSVLRRWETESTPVNIARACRRGFIREPAGLVYVGDAGADPFLIGLRGCRVFFQRLGKLVLAAELGLRKGLTFHKLHDGEAVSIALYAAGFSADADRIVPPVDRGDVGKFDAGGRFRIRCAASADTQQINNAAARA